MDDYSLVPVDHQPDFENVSLVPVEHDPFAAGGVGPPAQNGQAQATPIQGLSAQPQQTQTPPQSPLQPTPPVEPIGSGSPSSFADFFNQFAAPERAESEGVVDLVQNHPTAAKIVGALGLGSALAPPLAIAGGQALGLFGAGAVADGLANPALLNGGRAAASSAARQAISDAEGTLPEGITRQRFGELAGFTQGLAASSRASTEATADIISKLKDAGITSRSVAAFQKIYEGVARDNPSNLSAAHRAALLANILRNFE
jgi:hypothetical protein